MTSQPKGKMARSMVYRKVDLCEFMIRQELGSGFVPPKPKATDEVGFTQVKRKKTQKKKVVVVEPPKTHKEEFPTLQSAYSKKKQRQQQPPKNSNPFEL